MINIIVKKGVAVSSGYTVDKKIKIKPSIIIDEYIRNYSNELPSNINHDRTRTMAFTTKGPLIFKDGIVYQLINMNFPETKDEFDYLNQIILDNHYEYIEKNKQKISELKNMLGKHLSEDAKIVMANSIQIQDKDIVKRMFPELKGDSKDNLIDLRRLKKERYNHYSYKGFIIFPHEYFRRSYFVSNSINEEFLNVIDELAQVEELSVKIAIDYNLIGYLGTEQKDIELQYWWGPKFNNNLENIQYGVTTHQMKEEFKKYNRIIKTDFFWYNQNSYKTFEAEEVVDYTIYKNDEFYYPSRFVHSMLDKSNEPIHMDGAVRLYSESKHSKRLKQTIDKTKRDTDYTKLWRVDGTIPISKWKELLTHYYRDNKLIGEYLGGIDDIYGDNESNNNDDMISDENKDFFAFKKTKVIIDFFENDYLVYDNNELVKRDVNMSDNFYRRIISSLKNTNKIKFNPPKEGIDSIIIQSLLIVCNDYKLILKLLDVIEINLTLQNKINSFSFGLYENEILNVFSFIGTSSYLINIIKKIKNNIDKINNLSIFLQNINADKNNTHKLLNNISFDIIY